METFNATSQGVRLWDKNIGKAQLNGGLVYTRAAAKDANGRFGWVRGNASCFTDTATPAFEAPVYSSTAATDSSVINIVTVPGDDQITIGGSGLLLQPVTELQYVSMTAASGIVSNGNTLTFNGATAWTDGGLGAIVSGSFCPLEKVNSGALGGNTQYANMYTGGIESAVVTELPGSTGYGTLVNAISTITSVRPATGTDSATNSYIPTERAVALALAGKENIIVGGACVDVTKDVFSTTIAVKTQSETLPTLANAVNSRVPTERCARQAIDVTSEVLNASASALSNRITTLSTYVIDSTVKKTDYATTAAAGIVKIGDGLSMSGTNNDILYVTDPGGLQSFVVTGDNDIEITNSSTTGCTVNFNGAFKFKQGDRYNSTKKKFIVENPTFIDEHGMLIYHNSSISSTYISANTKTLWWASVSRGADVTLARAEALDSNGMIAWSSGTDTYYTVNSAYEQPVYKGPSVDSETFGHVISSYMSAGITSSSLVTPYTCKISSSYTALTSNYYRIPIASTIADASANATITQLHYGCIISGTLAARVTNTYTTAENWVNHNYYGGVVVMNTINKADTTAQSNYAVVPTVDAVARAISAGGGGLQSFTVSPGNGINVTGSSATGCTVSLAGDVTAGYNGPFKVTSVGSAVVDITGGTAINTKVSVEGGYVKWLDGNKWVVGSDTSTQTPVTSWTLSSATSDATKGWIGPSLTPDDTVLYLVGSSGAVAGQDIKAHSYSATVDDGTTQTVYTRTESQNATTSRFKWTGGTGSMWADPDLALDTVAYTDATGTTPIGSITNYKGTITLGTGANAVVYTRSSINEEAFVPTWTAANGEVQYTASAWPASSATASPVKTLYKIDEKFGYATSQGGLPPAGAFYTMLAQNQGGTIVQQQYGTVWHEHWGDDYKGQFAISRVALNDMSATQLPTPNTYPYAYIIGRGGRLYGGIPFNQGRFWGGLWSSGSLIIPPSDIWYPVSNVGGTSKNDALYFKYGTVNEVWLNIWSGTWPTTYGGTDQDAVNDMWYVVAHPECLEGKIPNCYSVQLGWVTGNGSPQQEHKGAIAIRGRWA